MFRARGGAIHRAAGLVSLSLSLWRSLCLSLFLPFCLSLSLCISLPLFPFVSLSRSSTLYISVSLTHSLSFCLSFFSLCYCLSLSLSFSLSLCVSQLVEEQSGQSESFSPPLCSCPLKRWHPLNAGLMGREAKQGSTNSTATMSLLAFRALFSFPRPTLSLFSFKTSGIISPLLCFSYSIFSLSLQ